MVSTGVGINQNDSAAKIANALHDHHGRLLVVTYLSVVYAAMFLIYLAKLYDLLCRDTDRPRFLGSLVLAGGTLFIALHAVSDGHSDASCKIRNIRGMVLSVSTDGDRRSSSNLKSTPNTRLPARPRNAAGIRGPDRPRPGNSWPSSMSATERTT